MAKPPELRRSTLIGAFGPGAVVDLRTPSGASVSGIVSGLESWDEAARNKGLTHRQVIHEPRLQKRLFVSGFRLPPVRSTKKGKGEEPFDILPIVRFPRWLQCPTCQRLKEEHRWSDKGPGRAELYCKACSNLEGGDVFVVPVRFIVACESGHIEDFPWKAWIQCDCPNPDLYLRTIGAGLGGKNVECDKCGKSRSLEGAFSKFALDKLSCSGRRPWLPGGDEACPRRPRVLQRGASNVYWDATSSALDIPPFSLDLADVFGRFADVFDDGAPDMWPGLIDALRLPDKTGLTSDQLVDYLTRYRQALESDNSPELYSAEYSQLDAACTQLVNEGEFRVRPEQVPPELTRWVSGLALADRLREVRALTGFTRIHPPSGPFRNATQRLAPLSTRKLDWLPAIELLGEGIFVRLNLERVKSWETQNNVMSRFDAFMARVKADLTEDERQPDCTPRSLLIHSLAHALMQRLSLECGYSSAALRERLYVDGEHPGMCGLLIHTGSPDAEGTLGGLVAQGMADRFLDIITGALREAVWCSQDPVCILGTATLSSPRNAAACHACLLTPETSCQWFNVLLDRATLVGTPDDPSLGFFSVLVKQLANS
jgi:hypothetical protein